jgi:hypothetical protein
MVSELSAAKVARDSSVSMRTWRNLDRDGLSSPKCPQREFNGGHGNPLRVEEGHAGALHDGRLETEPNAARRALWIDWSDATAA